MGPKGEGREAADGPVMEADQLVNSALTTQLLIKQSCNDESFQDDMWELAMLGHPCNSRAWEAEAGRS
jgi:hypothetical protein